MFSILGILIVLGAVVGGYLMEHGNLTVLLQPAELLIIGGAGLGTLLIAQPLPVIISILKGVTGILASGKYGKGTYLDTLKLLHELFLQARRGGMAGIEKDIEEPEKSPLLQKHPVLLKNSHALYFVCDTLRMAITGTVSHFDLDQMMDLDIEVHHKQVTKPVAALSHVADSLPGLGIVAAVLGVVITMGALGGPPEEIGHKVAAALVGTFLGILICYGFLSPLSVNLGHMNEAESQYFHCLKTGLIAFVRGAPPILAVEFSRRSIPAEVRPSFLEMETACKGAKNEVPVAA